jgi:hypothetical protein
MRGGGKTARMHGTPIRVEKKRQDRHAGSRKARIDVGAVREPPLQMPVIPARFFPSLSARALVLAGRRRRMNLFRQGNFSITPPGGSPKARDVVIENGAVS